MTKEALKLALGYVERNCPALVFKEIKEALAQPVQEPVEWATREDFYLALDRRGERIRKEMEIKTVTMRCKDYDVALPIIDMHSGHVFVGQVSTTPKRTWVGLTAQEAADCWTTSATKTWHNFEAALRSKNT